MTAPQQLGLTLRRRDADGAVRYARTRKALATEHQMQAAWCDRLSFMIAPPGRVSPMGVVWWSVDHANAASAVTGALRKKRGVISAIPDMVFHWEPARILYVEVKTVDGELSKSRTWIRRGRHVDVLGQEELHAALRSIFVPVIVVREWDELVAGLRGHGVPFTRESVA